MAIKEEYVYCKKLVSNNKEQHKIIQKFKSKFESRKKECAILIVHSASASDNWTIAGFNDEVVFTRRLIDDPGSELAAELKKDPPNKSKRTGFGGN